MSDSPPSRARAMQSRPTRSESSAWKNCLAIVSFNTKAKCTSYQRVIPRIRPVYSHFVNLLRVLSQVFDMSKDMTFTILAHKISEISSQAHRCNGRLVIAPFFDREPLKGISPLPSRSSFRIVSRNLDIRGSWKSSCLVVNPTHQI